MEFKEERKKLHSPGGRYCTCCNKWGKHPRKSKKQEERFLRRKLKLSLNKGENSE